MASNSKKTSDFDIVTALAATDRVVVLYNAAGANGVAQTATISLGSLLVASMLTLPTSDPHSVGSPWNYDGIFMISAG